MKKMLKYTGIMLCMNFLISTLCAAEPGLPAPIESAWHQPGFSLIQDKGPKITIIFMADSLDKPTLDMVNNFLTGGIGFLKQNGLNYQNVIHAFGSSNSAPGCAGLTTGTFANFHGITNNQWIGGDDQGGSPGFSFFLAQQDQDLTTAGVWNPVANMANPTSTAIYNYPTAAVYPSPIYTYYPNGSGVSSRNYKVDNVSDQIMLFSTPQLPTRVYSIATGAEPGALLAGHLGTAIWADNVTGYFTSSAYFYPNGIPDWIRSFNIFNPVIALNPDGTPNPSLNFTLWNPVYPVGSAAYDFPNAQNTTYQVQLPFPPASGSYLNKPIASVIPVVLGAAPFLASPSGIKHYFNFVKHFFDTQVDPRSNERIVLWLDNSAYNLVTALNGTQSENSIDTIYQLDQNLGDLMAYVNKKYRKENVQFVFLNSEGKYHSIPELLNPPGQDQTNCDQPNGNFNLAIRTVVGYPPNLLLPPPYVNPYPANKPCDLIEILNTELKAALSLPSQFVYVWAICPPFIYLNYDLFYSSLATPNQDLILQTLKTILLQQPGIKNVWTADEIYSFPFEKEDMERYFKLHLFRDPPIAQVAMAPYSPGFPHQERRSGELLFMPEAWNMLTSSATTSPNPYKGATHEDTYISNAATPLYIYQFGTYAKRLIKESVIPQQFAITLSQLLSVPRPSAAPIDVQPLPGISPPRN